VAGRDRSGCAINSSLVELAGRIASGNLSSVEAVSDCLDRIERLDPRIKAWTTLDKNGALETAAACDAEQKAGKLRGPLHGIPVGIKDIFETAGIPTRMGSPFFDGYVPARDAESIRRLKNAGGIILGKTVTTEFATLDPGPTHNPWNLEHTPGGSSSGSAAAVAARMCPAATGTQTAGSVGRPAAFCGIVGFMPTAERIPKDGVFPAAWSLDHVGAFGLSVADVQLMVEVMSGASLAHDPIDRPLRVGLVREYFQDLTEAEAWRRHEAFVDQLAGHGFDIVNVTLPDGFEETVNALWILMKSELAALHRERHAQHADRFGSRIRGFIEEGLRIPALDYVRVQRRRQTYRREMLGLFRNCDLLISPGAKGPAPKGLETTGDPALSIPWTLADFPTVSLPIGLDNSGMPLGIQLSAPSLEDAQLLTAGHNIEQVIRFEEHPTI
jgi:Asp-tRNA(Asn)/Glu-tRNA(Gln) amidotransferase A subunit family amidase